ncbi:MAG: hypothetical protein JOY87_05250 [Candidatus Eremiobacteraeota bacterium]|nr:hypothetical protein [Candidatus Eremiobacteraeota bacterium]
MLGPKNPHIVAQTIAHVCGAHACVVDANDLGKAEVLGASAAIRADMVRYCLLSNPAGNSDQQTPLVMLKYRPQPGAPARSPLLQAA